MDCRACAFIVLMIFRFRLCRSVVDCDYILYDNYLRQGGCDAWRSSVVETLRKATDPYWTLKPRDPVIVFCHAHSPFCSRSIFGSLRLRTLRHVFRSDNKIQNLELKNYTIIGTSWNHAMMITNRKSHTVMKTLIDDLEGLNDLSPYFALFHWRHSGWR